MTKAHEEIHDIAFWRKQMSIERDKLYELREQHEQLDKAYHILHDGIIEIIETDIIRTDAIKYIAQKALKDAESIVSI